MLEWLSYSPEVETQPKSISLQNSGGIRDSVQTSFYFFLGTLILIFRDSANFRCLLPIRDSQTSNNMLSLCSESVVPRLLASLGRVKSVSVHQRELTVALDWIEFSKKLTLQTLTLKLLRLAFHPAVLCLPAWMCPPPVVDGTQGHIQDARGQLAEWPSRRCRAAH